MMAMPRNTAEYSASRMHVVLSGSTGLRRQHKLARAARR